MKKSLLLLLAVLCSGYKVWAQDCSTIPPNNEKVYHWCYQQNEGTSWNTTPYKAYILNGMPFRLLFPKGFDSTAVSTKKYPLVILLHGIGQSGTDNNHQLKYGCEDHLKALNSGAYDGFVMVPQSSESLWGTSQRAAVLKFVELAIRDLKVDQFRVQLEGYSGGATAAWKLAYENPKIFAAAIPMSSADGTIASWAEILKYTAIWHAQGGRDTQPAPNTGNNVAKSFQNVGANYKYQYYHNLGHGTWFAMYKEPDFFPFLMRNSQLRIHARFFKYNFCEGEAVSGIMGVTQGFEDYEWRKNAQLIYGANANELNFSGEGAYTVRIKHKGVWSAWSEALNVQRIAPTPTPTVIATGPTALPSLDGKRTVTLRAPKGFQDYEWSNNSTLDSLVVTTAGSYSASVTEAYGCPSTFSAPVKVTFNAVGVLPAPGNLTVATTSETSLTLNWLDNSSNETGFEIYRRISIDVPWSLVAQLPANRSSYEDKGLQPYTRYHYSIRSVNNDGGSVYISGTGKTSADLQSPGIPASLEVAKTSRTSIGLKWQPAADNASASGITYQIFANNKTTLLATTTKTELTLQGLAEKQSYNFAVRAIDGVGNISDFSNQVSTSTHIDGLYYTYYEGGVSNVHNISLLDPIKSGRIPNIDIVTNRSRDDYFAFKFEGYLNITTAGTYTFYTTSDDGSTLTINGVEVVNNNGRHSSQERSGTINLTAGLHEFTVLYFEANGNGEKLEVRWQGPGITKQLMPDAAFTENFSLPGKPVAPGNLTATAADHQRILLKWTDNSSNESGFEVFRSASSGGPYQLVKTTAANATQYSDAGLQAATNYHYKVRAIGNTGESTYSAQVSSSTTAAPSTLPAPASLKAFRQSATAAALSWTDQADFESGFEIWRGTDGITFTKIMTLGSNATSFTDNTISSSNSFHYKIRAVYNSTYSAWSNVTALSTGNKAPVMGGLPAQVSAPESTTTEILFDLSDPEGASLQLTSRYLPTFARIEQASATKGRIILNPGVKDIGYYSGIQLTASDGQLETDVTFSISVKNDEKTAIYINMGNSSVAGKPWNNTNTYGGVTNKEVLKNILDENGTNTGYSLTIIDPWSTNKPYGETSGNDSGIYPDIVTNSAYIIYPGKSVRFKVSGLKANLRYNFVFFGSNIYKSNGGNTHYTIGSETVSLAIQSNISKTAQINGVMADANGEVVVTVAGASNATKGGYLNALVIEEYPDNSPMLRPGRMDAVAASQTQIDLSWTDKSHQESGFEIWRRILPSGTFAKIATTAANATSYTDSGLSPNTGYEYKVRAIGGGTFSKFTETIQAATLRYQVFINAEYSSSAPNPWNNLSRRPTSGSTWFNFKDEALQRTGINMRLDESFDGDNLFGPNANGAGIYPDKVIKSFYFNEIASVAKIRLYGLDDNLTYNFRFFAASAFGSENGVSEYRIGAKKATLDVQQNLQNTALIRDVQPTNGSIVIEVEAGEFARYGYLSALEIEVRDGQKEIGGTATPGENQAPVANAGADKEITLPTSQVNLAGSGTDADGTIASYSWSQVSGPNTATFSSKTIAAPQLSNLIEGSYVFSLTVKDDKGAASTADQVTVKVNAASGTNQPPVANAGTDKEITLPTSSVVLDGSGSDTDGTIVAYSWSQVSGPNTASFSSKAVAKPTVSNLLEGNYVFRLSVTDDKGATHNDDVAVKVNPSATTPGNTAYRINAGGTSTTTSMGEFAADNYYTPSTGYQYKTTAGISGTEDDAIYQTARGSERTNSNFAYEVAVDNGQYTVVLHFAELSFSSIGQRVFDVSLEGNKVLDNYDIIEKAGGRYVATTETFTINVSDGTLNLYFSSISEDGGANRPLVSAIEVIANGTGSGTTNQPPVANAGTDKEITLPTSSVVLDGSGSDTDGTIVAYSWSQVSGPNTASFSSKAVAKPTVSNLLEGSYVFRLSVTDDKGATHADDATVKVNPASSTPGNAVYRINAGGPANTNSIGSFTADAYFTPSTGYLYKTTAGISGTEDDAIYQTARGSERTNSNFAYEVAVDNGQYTVVLHFAELSFSSIGQRVFDVSLEGNKVLDNYDIFLKAGGRYRAVTETFVADVNDGTLTLLFSSLSAEGGMNRPLVSAIEVIPGTSANVRGLATVSASPEIETFNASISVYPNPTQYDLFVEFEAQAAGSYMVQILDLTGRTMQTKEVTAQEGKNTWSVDLRQHSISPGMYLLRIKSADYESKIIRILKQ